MKNPLGKLFQRREQTGPGRIDNTEIPTGPLDKSASLPETEEDLKPSSVILSPTQMHAACAQSVGKVRNYNEDSVFCMTTSMASYGHDTPAGLFIVADGMGGHQHGEVASHIAIHCVAGEVMEKTILAHINADQAPMQNNNEAILNAAVMEAHRAIYEEAPGSGTTLTAVLVMDNQMSIAHVGDSRLYLVNKENEASILTRDHSLVMRMIELGHLTEEQATVHPQRNVLYRALGQGEPMEPDMSTMPLPDGGYILLCTDGLWGVVPRAEIVQIISRNPQVEIAAQRLIDAANAAGGPDNISVILVKLPRSNSGGIDAEKPGDI